MATLDEFIVIATDEVEAEKPLMKNVNGIEMELSDTDYSQLIIDRARYKHDLQNNEWHRNRKQAYPNFDEFVEAYTEKEILGESAKWDSYTEQYNQVRTDFPKPSLTEAELSTDYTEEPAVESEPAE